MPQRPYLEFINRAENIWTDDKTLYHLARIILTDNQTFQVSTADADIKLEAVEATEVSYEKIIVHGHFKSSSRSFRYEFYVQVDSSGSRTIVIRHVHRDLYHRQILISTLQPEAQRVLDAYHGMYSLTKEKFIGPSA